MKHVPLWAIVLLAGSTLMADDKSPATTDVPAVKVAVRGVVTKANGSPAAGAEVFAGGAGYQPERFQARARCDGSGRFELQVAADMYYLFVATLGDEVSLAKTAVIRTGKPAGPIELELAQSALVFGSVKRGKTAKVAVGETISLALIDAASYAKLPEGERLPNPQLETKAIAPRVIRDAITNDQGEYEFAAGVGQYAVTGKDIDGPAEIEFKSTSLRPGFRNQQQVNLHLGQDQERFTGRVVFKSDPRRGVQGAVVWGLHFTGSGDIYPVFTDAEGKFATKLWFSSSIGGGGRPRNLPPIPGPPPATGTFVMATSSDGLLAGIVELAPDKLEAEIAIEPTASIRGRVVDGAGSPQPGRQINYGVKFSRGELSHTMQFGGSAISNAKGEVVMNGLVPGWTYSCDETMRFTGSFPTMFHQVGSATPEKAETLNLGDLVVSASNREGPFAPTSLAALMLREVIGRNRSYPWADERLRHKLRDAKVAGQPILLLLTPGTKDVSEQFFTMLYEAEQTRKFAAVQDELARLVVVAIDTSEKRSGLDFITPLLKRLKLPLADDGGGTFAILDSNAQLLTTKTAPELSVAGRLDVEKLQAFLRLAPPKP